MQHGPLPYSALVPCTSFAVPNNTLRDARGRTVVISLAVDAQRRRLERRDGARELRRRVLELAGGPVAPPDDHAEPHRARHGRVLGAGQSSTCTVSGLVRLGTSDALELAF